MPLPPPLPRILIDVTRLLYRRATRTLPTGIDRVGIAYVKRYGDGARAVLARGPFGLALPRGASRALFRAVSGVEPDAARGPAAGAGRRFLFNTGHAGLESPSYAGWLRRRGVRLVTVVHDLIPLTHPEFCRPSEFEAHRARMRCAALASAGIVANSRHTLAAFDDFCAREGIAHGPAAVAHLGPGLPALAPGGRPMAEPYFVVLGTIEARKNHALVLHLWRRLAEAQGARAPRLVVIGQRGWESEGAIDLLERCRAIRGLVVEKGRCADAELATWLAHARALLFPSFAEGYGMPLAEALARGVPAIASDLPAFREIAGDIPDYATPLDGARWQALVEDYALEGSPLRAAQLARLAAFRPATWNGHFAVVDELLGSLA